MLYGNLLGLNSLNVVEAQSYYFIFIFLAPNASKMIMGFEFYIQISMVTCVNQMGHSDALLIDWDKFHRYPSLFVVIGLQQLGFHNLSSLMHVNVLTCGWFLFSCIT